MLKIFLTIVFKTFLIILIAIGFYLVAAFTVPKITVNNYFVNKKEGVKVFIISNGVHTDIVLPMKTSCKDWTGTFPKENFDVKDSVYNHIGFGWGDKGFYLDTPTWSDLKFSTAFKAAFGLGSTAMHVRYLKQPKEQTEKCVELLIDETIYTEIVNHIENSFEKDNNTIIKIDHPGYNDFDRFFEAKGTYSAFKTCNIWTNNCLRNAGVKVALWSPFSSGLIHSLK